MQLSSGMKLKEAKLLGKDPYSLYESSSYFKGEAKARAEAKSREETNKNKVKSPTSQMVNGNVDYSNVSDSDIANMSIQEFEKFSDWKAAQSKNRRNRLHLGSIRLRLWLITLQQVFLSIGRSACR